MTQSGVGVFIYRCGEYLCLSHEARSGRELPRLSAPPSFVFHVVTGRVLCALWPHLLQVQAAEGESWEEASRGSRENRVSVVVPLGLLRCRGQGVRGLMQSHRSMGGQEAWSLDLGNGAIWFLKPRLASKGQPLKSALFIYIYIYTRRCLNHI